MRLLIYLLALVSGFSAAEAARAEITPASSVAQTAVVAAEALASQVQAASDHPANHQPLSTDSQQLAYVIKVAVSSPITRHDLSRE
jgi:hypothetical protein